MSLWCGNMEDVSSSFNWEWDYQEEQAQEITELKHAFSYPTPDLETRIVCAHEEIARKRNEVLHYKCLLTETVKERDEVQLKCRRLVLNNHILRQEVQKFEANAFSFVKDTPITYIDHDPIVEVVSSSGSNEKIDRTKESYQTTPQPPLQSQSASQIIDNMVLTKRLPEKGKFLQAMMETRPLLQTLLIVGPLPEWQKAPPQPSPIKMKIPTIPLSFASTPRMLLHQDSCINVITNDDGELFSKKRGLEHSNKDYDFPSTTYKKNQKVVH